MSARSRAADPNPSAVALGAATKAAPVLSMLAHRARTAGTAAAFRHLPESEGGAAVDIDWRRLHAQVHEAGTRLICTPGLRRGDRVLLTFPPGPDFVTALLACFHAGLVAVPVAPPRRRGAGRWVQVHRDAGAALVLTAPSLLAELERLCHGEDLGPCLAIGAEPRRPSILANPLPVLTEDIAVLQYTSGSTGTPRGVIVTHGMIDANLEQIRAAFGYRPGDRILSWLPYHHDMGLMSSVLTPVHLGTPCTTISPAAFLRDPLRFLRLAGETGATVIGGPNFGYELCARKAAEGLPEGLDLSRLRLAFTGAERIEAGTLDRFAAAFAPAGFDPRAFAGCYGMAEATVCVTVAPPGRGVRRAGRGADRPPLPSSGVPAPGIDLAIVDPSGPRRLAERETGEIWIRGPNVAPGYWRQPEASAQTFGRVLDGLPGWLRSGDLGFLADGELYVTGRIRELVVIRGQNHHPQDIEATVAAACPALLPERIAAFQLDGDGDGRLGLACELTRAARSGDPAPVFGAIRGALAEAHGIVPERIELLRPGSLPVTSSGKIRRSDCRGGVEGALAVWTPGDGSAPSAAPAGALAASLAALPAPLRAARLSADLRSRLAARLGPGTPIGDDLRFFDMGLDSASGALLVAELERQTGLRLDASVIYEFPTPAGLARHLLAEMFPPAAARSPQ